MTSKRGAKVMTITGKQLKEDAAVINDIIRKYDDNAGGVCMLTVKNDEGDNENGIMASGNMFRLGYMVASLCVKIAQQMDDTAGKAWFMAIVKQVCEEMEIDPANMAEAIEFVKAATDDEEDEDDAE